MARPAKLTTVAKRGDRRETLERLRDELAAAIDNNPPMRDLAALSNRLMQVLDALEQIGPERPAKESKRDELARRRTEREAAG